MISDENKVEEEVVKMISDEINSNRLHEVATEKDEDAPPETIDCGFYTHYHFGYDFYGIELRTYKCKLCPKTNFNKSCLMNHIEMMHPSTIPTPEPEPPDPNLQDA